MLWLYDWSPTNERYITEMMGAALLRIRRYTLKVVRVTAINQPMTLLMNLFYIMLWDVINHVLNSTMV